MSSTYLIATTMGKSLVDSENYVYVQVNNKEFIRKRPYDLRKGEMIVFEKPFTTTSLEDVEPYLERSPRYAHAVDVLHEKNSRNERITKLRAYLIKGLADHDIVSRDNLEARIMGESEDFTKQEYRAMTEYIRNHLTNSNSYIPGEDTIDYWLRGFVRAPADWNTFKILERINPQFREFVPDEDNPTSTYFNYRLWRVIRQSIMRYLNNCKGTTVGGPPEEEQKESKISLSPEYEIIFNHFIKDLTIDSASARVIDVNKIDNQKTIQKIKEDAIMLSDGVVNSKNHKLDVRLLDWLGLWEQFHLYDHCLSGLVEDYEPFKVPASKKFDMSSQRIRRNNLRKDLINEFCKKYGEGLEDIEDHYNFTGIATQDELKKEKETRRELGNKMFKSILDGDTDRFFGFSHGTSMEILEAMFQSRKSLPEACRKYIKSIINYNLLITSPLQVRPVKWERKLKEYRERIKMSKKLLEKDYGLVFRQYTDNEGTTYLLKGARILISSFITQEDVKIYSKHPYMNSKTPRELLKNKNTNMKILEKARKRLPQSNSFMSENQAREILNKNRLEKAISLVKENFIWERM